MTAAATATATPEPLKTIDRCDRCGAEAMVRTIVPTGSELFFCNHHHRDHADRLDATGARSYDKQGNEIINPDHAQ